MRSVGVGQKVRLGRSGERGKAHGCVSEEQRDREELSVRDTRWSTVSCAISSPCPFCRMNYLATLCVRGGGLSRFTNAHREPALSCFGLFSPVGEGADGVRARMAAEHKRCKLANRCEPEAGIDRHVRHSSHGQ